VLSPGQNFQVPSTATAPMLRTGKPEALRITVGSQAAPAVGPAATTVRDVSLLPADLMRGPQQAQPAANAPASQTQPSRNQAAPAANSPPQAENPSAAVTNDGAAQ
jgi:cytoskeleton protein RodZ